ncbi:MAG: heme-binding beta-barrel domain-containing protein [Bacteroidota bacterium]
MQTKIDKEILLDTIRPLYVLEGKWTGYGKGNYPTLNEFSYKEETCFKTVANEPYILMTQKTWLIGGGQNEFIHMETGIISAIDMGVLRFYTCHMNGRIEIMTGKYLGLTKDSIAFVSDLVKNEINLKQALSSSRIFKFNPNVFE